MPSTQPRDTAGAGEGPKCSCGSWSARLVCPGTEHHPMRCVETCRWEFCPGPSSSLGDKVLHLSTVCAMYLWAMGRVGRGDWGAGCQPTQLCPKRSLFHQGRQLGSKDHPAALCRTTQGRMRGGHHRVTGLSLCWVVWQSSVPVSQCLQTNPQMRKHLVSAAGCWSTV